MPTPMWTPSEERISTANLSHFIDLVKTDYALNVSDYASLYQWSIDQPDHFWLALWRFCDVRYSQPWQHILENREQMPGARWFTGARLNFAENLLHRRDEHPAIIAWNEHGRQNSWSYQELYTNVALLTDALRAAGISVGDRVAGYLPNIPETVAAMLATASIGAIWSSCSPDFGVNGLSDRFSQIAPKILFTVSGYIYNGNSVDSLARVRAALPQLPSIEKVVVIPYPAPADLTDLPKAIPYSDFVGHQNTTSDIFFTQLPFEHPLYILYSSGTTGVPKCIVHSAGGTLLQHLKELILHTDLKYTDRIFYFTTCGWMMWNWLVSSLAVGATVVLYDGSPFHPQPRILWDLAEQERITIFGTSAKYLASLEKVAVTPRATHRLDALKAVLSTGSPLAPESFDYVYRDIKSDLQLSSISGGTDIISCFALGNPILPVYRGELQCRGLGMHVDVVNDAGLSVRGEKGELVCRAPFPSMPIGFWNDTDGEKYRQAYFARFPGIWAHGDYAELTEHDGMIIYGRSDAVLNPGGVRIGTAEIYRQVEAIPEVLESLAVGQEWENDVRILLFVILRAGISLDTALVSRIKNTIRQNASPRHVPAKIIQVPDLPRTRNGKLVELAVREVIHGRPVKNIDALANPEALEFFREREELRTD